MKSIRLNNVYTRTKKIISKICSDMCFIQEVIEELEMS